MNDGEWECIRVLARFSPTSGKHYFHRVAPLRFKRRSGEAHLVRRIRRIYGDRRGARLLVHFVVETEENRFFDLVYEPQRSLWYVGLEVDPVPYPEEELPLGF